MIAQALLITLLAAPLLPAQAKKPFQTQTPATLAYSLKDGAEVYEMTNVGFEITNQMLLRKVTKERHVFDEIDVVASTTVEAWPLGVDVKQRPSYTVTAAGNDPRTVNMELFTISRGLEEVAWWSVYRLANGARLFDTYVPLVSFSISRAVLTERYAGIEVPEYDTQDARLRAPGVVGVVTYASADRVIREALITCDDPKRAELLRSFADSARSLTFVGGSLRLTITQNYPSAPSPVTIAIPVAKDDLDTAKAQAPAGIHVAPWKR